MSYTRKQWSSDVLKALGNDNPSQYTLSFVIAWTIWETSANSGAAYNLLNTTQKETGSTTFNSVGVQNYVSYSQGIQATVETLNNGLYSNLVKALTGNDDTSLGNVFVGFANPSDAVNHDLNTWSGNAGYGAKVASTAHEVEMGGDTRGNDTFQGQSSSIPSTTGGSSSSSRPSIKLTPNSGVTDVLMSIDDTLAITNPFNVVNPPTANIFGASFVDPMGWLSDFGANLTADLAAVVLRIILIIFGVIIAWKGVKQFITVDPIGSGLNALQNRNSGGQP